MKNWLVDEQINCSRNGQSIMELFIEEACIIGKK
jgi:hypothetical protein